MQKCVNTFITTVHGAAPAAAAVVPDRRISYTHNYLHSYATNLQPQFHFKASLMIMLIIVNN